MGMGARLIDVPADPAGEHEQAMAEFREEAYRAIQRARAGKATEEDWQFIEMAAGVSALPAPTASTIGDNSAIPF